MRRLRARYPGLSFEQIGVKAVEQAVEQALERPGCAEDLKQLGAKVVPPVGSREAYVYVPTRYKEAFGRFVVAVMLPDDEGAKAAADTSSQRDPLPVPQVERVVRLRLVDRYSWPEIEKKKEIDLSHRKIDYVRVALHFGDLGWDLADDCIALGPETRNTPAGLVLPRR